MSGNSSDEELQREVTRLALSVLEGTGFALAGSGAIREHGVTDRATEDIDLFTSNVNVDDFAIAVDRVVGELIINGFGVEAGRRSERFARLHIHTGEGREVDIDMGVDWRESEPVTLAIGPVLSLEDAIGNKVSALYSRAEARDFLDVDAIRASGRYTDKQLLTAAAERDAGFELSMFVRQLDRAEALTFDRVQEYGIAPEALIAIKYRFATWATGLRRNVEPDAETPGDN